MKPLSKQTQKTILKEAEELIYGERAKSYGSVLKNFTRTAQMWSAILGTTVTASQVGMCMIAIKISRQCHKESRDNLIDIAGYAGTLEKLRNEDPLPPPPKH